MTRDTAPRPPVIARLDGRHPISVARLLLAASGGVLLFLADFPVEWPWLQLIAFVPLLWTALDARSDLGAAAYGAAWVLGRVVPLAWMLDSFGLPPTARAGLVAYLLGLGMVFAVVIFRMRAGRTWLFALAVAVAFTGLEILDARLPMWGTATALARAWSVFPRACGLIRLGAAPALALVVVGAQASVVLAARRGQRRIISMALAGLGASVVLSATPGMIAAPTLRVAAVGWGSASDAPNAAARVDQASAAGARLVVFPEVAFRLEPGGRAELEPRWSRLARDRRVCLVVPFEDRERPGNRVMVFDSRGNKQGEYTKHHPVPLAEPFSSPADAPLLTFAVDGVRVGVAICQDDNFTDVARAYARRGVQLLVVPTFEGPPAVAPYHLRNSVLRTIENPIAVVRATAQGPSAAIAPGGFIVAAFDHARRGAGVLVADVPIGRR